MTVTCFDWMHTYIVNGVFNSEVGYLMQALVEAGVTNKAVHDGLQRFTWPKRARSTCVTGQNVFEKRKRNDADLIKCTASEALALYPVLRVLLMELVPHSAGAVKDAIDSGRSQRHTQRLDQPCRSGAIGPLTPPACQTCIRPGCLCPEAPLLCPFS